jgi:hypothetical protein
MPHPLPDTPAGVDELTWAATVAEVRAYCGWHIAPEVTETITVDGPGGPVLTLPTLRLVDLVSITNDGNLITDPDWSSSGMVHVYGPVTYHYGAWSRRLRGVVAEITHGYEEWPLELFAVMTEMATTNSSAFAGIRSVASGSHSFTLESSLRPAQSEVLGRYQLPFIP